MLPTHGQLLSYINRTTIKITYSFDVVEGVRRDDLTHCLWPSTGITNADVELYVFVDSSVIWIWSSNCVLNRNNARCPETVALTAFLLSMLWTVGYTSGRCNHQEAHKSCASKVAWVGKRASRSLNPECSRSSVLSRRLRDTMICVVIN